LYGTDGHAVVVVQSGEGFTEAMQSPVGADSFLGAAFALTVDAAPAIQSFPFRQVLKLAQKMPLRLSERVREDEAAVWIPPPPRLHPFDEIVRNGNPAFFAVLRCPVEVALVLNQELVAVEVDVSPCRGTNLLLTATRHKEELEEVSLLLIGDCRLRSASEYARTSGSVYFTLSVLSIGHGRVYSEKKVFRCVRRL